ncbi:amino acid adenylation domain-containing protein [Micromonospora gifhornensis]|uniref:amino acid adenylation domain-containing protein n=1 Tax=Micromonospora gifhornensis TaxID=84594 RepID=UPI003653A21C
MQYSSIQERFAAQVDRAPDATAVTFGDVRLSYRELDERANRLAHRLLALGVSPEQPIAISLERSVELVVATLAVLKAGASYLPLHSAYPVERMQWIVDEAGAHILLTDAASQQRGVPRTDQVVDLSTADPADDAPTSRPAVATGPEQLAYVIYTSGSTGRPKGVAVPHRGVLALVSDSCFDGGAHQRVAMVAPYAFSVSSYELWVPLLRGGHLVVAPPGVPDVQMIQNLIIKDELTALHLTAGLFRVIAEEAPECLGGLREVLTGGDVIAPTAVQRVLEACPSLTVRAMYGQSEATLFTLTTPLTAPYQPQAYVPLGRPLDHIRHHVLDDQGRPVAPGMAGELYLAGDALALGYLNRPELTDERFVADPFAADGTRMYRTGDLVRQGDDGQLEFIARVGAQVKIRGFRVEPAEVAAVLAEYPGLADVAVEARQLGPDDTRLVAYVVPAATTVDVSALRPYAMGRLPEYMVPAATVVLDRLPLTANGKLDRQALPVPDFDNVSTYGAPQNARQETLCRIFADVLGVDRIGIDDSFFDLGGQSLLAMRLTSRIGAELGVELPLAAIFDCSTVASLDDYLAQESV